MSYSLADWCSMLGFVWAIGASYVAWLQGRKRKHEAQMTVTFLHGLKPAIQGGNRDAVVEQINDQLERLDPPKAAR